MCIAYSYVNRQMTPKHLIAADQIELETADDATADDTPRVIADGGSDASAHFSDTLIQSAINDHNSNLSVAEVRTILGELQLSFDENTLDWIEQYEEGTLERVTEAGDFLVFVDTSGDGWHDKHNWIDIDDPEDQQVIMTIHRRAAELHSAKSQFQRAPLMFRKPAGFNAGIRYARHDFVEFVKDGLTPAEALDTIMVMKHGFTQTKWAEKRGKTQPSISGNIKSGERKILDKDE